MAGVKGEGVRGECLGCAGVPDAHQQLEQLVDAAPCRRRSKTVH